MRERLRGLREDQEISQKDMARILNIAQTTYSDYELGKINIPIDALCKLALYFQTSVDYILDLTDDSRPYTRKRPE